LTIWAEANNGNAATESPIKMGTKTLPAWFMIALLSRFCFLVRMQCRFEPEADMQTLPNARLRVATLMRGRCHKNWAKGHIRRATKSGGEKRLWPDTEATISPLSDGYFR
jgi:hypothetical protein